MSERLPHRMAVLFVITYLIICSFYFDSTPRVARLNPGIAQAMGSYRPELQHRRETPTDRSIKIRKKVTYISPPVSASVKVNKFIHTGEAKLIRTVLVPKLFSYTVVQQPASNPYYVSSSKELVTEFSLAREYDNIGLLAHNNLAGKAFKHLKVGQEIYIVHESGHADGYIVSNIYRFQALDSTNTESQFVDLDTGETLTATELFTRMYTGAPHLTFQTCIDAEGDPSWGRLFVIATQANQED